MTELTMECRCGGKLTIRTGNPSQAAHAQERFDNEHRGHAADRDEHQGSVAPPAQMPAESWVRWRVNIDELQDGDSVVGWIVGGNIARGMTGADEPWTTATWLDVMRDVSPDPGPPDHENVR